MHTASAANASGLCTRWPQSRAEAEKTRTSPPVANLARKLHYSDCLWANGGSVSNNDT